MSEAPHLVRLGRWAAGLAAGDVPEDVRRAAGLQLCNMVAAAHAGARSAVADPVLAGTRALAGAGRATVLAGGDRLAPGDAALVNAACSMVHDFDDIVWMGHTCHSAVFAALAVAEHEGADAGELWAAIAIANELGGRLGASSILGPLNGQMWTFVHLMAAAAATARLLRLDGEQTAHALAIALAQPNFALQPAFMAPTSKLLSAATPTATGIQAAYFARAGMTGALDLLEDRRGFWARFSYLPLPMMLADLGQLWVMRTLTVKTYPGCHYFQTACTAVEQILARTGPLRPDQVRAVRVATTKLGCEASSFAAEYAAPTGPIAPVNVNFDLAITVALMLHAGRLGSAELSPAWLAAQTDAIRTWRALVAVEHDPALTAQTIAAAGAVGAGRAALAGLRPADLPRLARRYRDEYRSTLVSGRELYGWLRWAARRATRRRSPGAERRGVEAGAPPAAIPLPFPNAVSIELADGRTETARVDLPVGSLAAADMQAALARKLFTEAGPSIGEERARRLLAVATAPETARLADLLDLATAR